GTTRRQSIAKQNARAVADTLEIVSVQSGAGVTSFLRPKPEGELVGVNQSHEHGVGKPGPGEHG
ncbi:MAG: hypothetical protein M3N26_08945, partial [Pseudomonadota bacterium]|nr:hypothetical protein [Pseudomonadota bacterium]